MSEPGTYWPGRYAGRGVLVTGGAGGIGAAIAARLAAESATVGILDLDPAAVDVAVAALTAAEPGGRIHGYAADVTDDAAVTSATAAFVADAGRIDALVTAAGVLPVTPFDALDAATWRRIVDINLTGTFLSAKAALTHMKAAGYGRIVTISSETVLIGGPAQAPYIASKAGVIGFTRSLANEAGPHGVTVNAVLPGLIDTAQVHAQFADPEAFLDRIVATQAIPRRGQPDDIAAAVAYLASAEASWVTGQSLVVGGGDRFL
jgi:pyridoxal 4-dehydrogenase